jgi:hypothetical protein
MRREAQATPCLAGREPAQILFSICCTCLAGIFLLLGLIFYVNFRTELPAPLEHLHLRSHAPTTKFGPGAVLGSLPSLLHVTAFTLLISAIFRPSALIALAAGAILAGINILWELSCANQQAWLRLTYGRIGIPGPVPKCTYDVGDIAAAVAGAALASLLVLFLLKVRPNAARDAKERVKW